MYVCVFVIVSARMRARRATIASAMFTTSRLLMDEGYGERKDAVVK